MTSEQRLDRLERIAKLLVRAGLRARRQMREQNEKINILIASQMKTDERLVKTDERLAALAEAQAGTDSKMNLLLESQRKNDERFAALAESQARSDGRLDRLVDTVDRFISERRNGNP